MSLCDPHFGGSSQGDPNSICCLPGILENSRNFRVSFSFTQSSNHTNLQNDPTWGLLPTVLENRFMDLLHLYCIYSSTFLDLDGGLPRRHSVQTFSAKFTYSKSRVCYQARWISLFYVVPLSFLYCCRPSP